MVFVCHEDIIGWSILLIELHDLLGSELIAHAVVEKLVPSLCIHLHLSAYELSGT